MLAQNKLPPSAAAPPKWEALSPFSQRLESRYWAANNRLRGSEARLPPPRGSQDSSMSATASDRIAPPPVARAAPCP